MVNRRSFVSILAAAATLPRAASAELPRQIMWDDLIPPGVPYSEIVGEGEMDIANDTWVPIYDANGTKLNEALDGAYIKMPGYVLPFDISADGVTDFMLVPYVGACVHTPPPPANQLVVVNTKKPWPMEQLWEPVWVTGTLRTQLSSTNLGQTGYALSADVMEVYVW